MTVSNKSPISPGNTLRRVLVIRFGPLAGYIQALGAASVIREVHRAAHITLLTTPEFAEFSRACPYFNAVEDDGETTDSRQRAVMVKRCREAGYDMVYDLQNDSQTVSFLREFKSRFWSGAATGASHHHANDQRDTLNPLDRFADQLYYAGIGPGGLKQAKPWPEGYAPLPDLSWIRPALRHPPHLEPAYFTLYGPYALIIPGHAGDTGAPESWKAPHYGEICNRLFRQGVKPVLIGDKGDAPLAKAIMSEAPDTLNLMTRTDLFQLAQLAQNALLTIGGNTGAVHVAAASGRPLICLIAQPWNPEMSARLGSVWHSETRLSQSAPRGGLVVVETAPDLNQLSPDDIWQTIKNLNVINESASG